MAALKGEVMKVKLQLLGRLVLLSPDGVEITPRGNKAQAILAILGLSDQYITNAIANGFKICCGLIALWNRLQVALDNR